MYLCGIKFIMPKIFLIVLFYLVPGFLFAQKSGSISIISDSSIPLIIYLDNVKQNDSAVSQIRIEGLTDKYYRVRGIRGDTSYFERYLFVVGYEDKLLDATYKIRRLNTGRIRVSLYAMLPTDYNFKAPSTLYVIKGKIGTDDVAENSSPKPKFDSSWIAQQKALLEDPEIRNDKKVIKNQNSIVKKDDKKISSSATKSPSSKAITKDIPPSAKNEKKLTATAKPGIALKKCNGWPITKKDFELLKKTISESKTENIKLKNAKSLITGSCFLVSQIDEITALLKSEEAKLDFVQFAYSYTIDRPNYPRLEKYFTSQKNKEQFSLIHGD